MHRRAGVEVTGHPLAQQSERLSGNVALALGIHSLPLEKGRKALVEIGQGPTMGSGDAPESGQGLQIPPHGGFGYLEEPTNLGDGDIAVSLKELGKSALTGFHYMSGHSHDLSTKSRNPLICSTKKKAAASAAALP